MVGDDTRTATGYIHGTASTTLARPGGDRVASATGYMLPSHRLHKERNTMRLVRRAVIGVMCLLLASAAQAQVTTADILGRVTDSSGAVLPGVTITVVNTATRDTRTLTSNDTG